MKTPGSARPVFGPNRARCLQQLVGSPDVRINERIGTVNRAVHVRLGGEMHDRVDAFPLDDVAHRVTVANVALHERELLVVCHGLETRQIAGIGQSVQPDDLVAWMMLRPELDKVAANESRRARNEHSTHLRHIPQSSISLCCAISSTVVTRAPPAAARAAWGIP